MMILPSTLVTWNGVDISDAAFNIEISWGNTEEMPGITMSVDPFKIPKDLVDSMKKEIFFSHGYPGRSAYLTGTFLHNGTSQSFGSSKALSITGLSKAATLGLGPKRQRNFVGDSTIAEIINSKAREYKYKISKYFLTDDLSLRECLQLNETDAEYLVHLAKINGSKIYWTIDNDEIGKLTPSTSFDFEHSEKIDPKAFSLLLLGPTLLEAASREIKVETPAAKPKLEGKKQEGKKDPDKDAKPKKKDTVTTPIAKKADDLNKKQVKASAESPYSKKTSKTEKVKERKKDEVKEQEVTLTTDFLCVPKVVGLKPGDAIYFVDDKLDYKIESVSYKQSGQYFRLSVTAKRGLGTKDLFPKNKERIDKRLKELGTDEYKWADYYWNPKKEPPIQTDIKKTDKKVTKK